MKGKRRSYTAEFKAQVAIEVQKGQKSKPTLNPVFQHTIKATNFCELVAFFY